MSEYGCVITREQNKCDVSRRTCLVVTAREGLSRQYKHWDMYLFNNSLEDGAVRAMGGLARSPGVRQ